MIRRSSATSASTAAGPSASSSRLRVLGGGAASRASATSTVRLPSIRSSPAGLPVDRRVAEDAEQVVAQLERLAERQPERGSAAPSCRARRRRPARRRCGAAARWSTSRTCSAAPSSPASTSASPARLHGHVEELAGDHLAAGAVEDVERARTTRPAAGRSGAAARRTSCSSRSPSRIAADGAVLLRVAAPAVARGARASNARWVAGRPRRVSEASM